MKRLRNNRGTAKSLEIDPAERCLDQLPVLVNTQPDLFRQVAILDKDKPPHKYYDRQFKDYQEWNQQEERSYKHWLEERRENYRDFARTSR